MKTLIIIGHPNLAISKTHSALIQEAQKHPELTLNILSEKYGKNIININQKEEQELVIHYDKIVLQFPFYWYSYPPLLKSWLDIVFTDALNGKTEGKMFIPVISTGSPEEAYSHQGSQNFEILELITPLIQTANKSMLKITKPYMIYGGNNNPHFEQIVKNYPSYLLQDSYEYIGKL